MARIIIESDDTDALVAFAAGVSYVNDDAIEVLSYHFDKIILRDDDKDEDCMYRLRKDGYLEEL